MVDYQVADQGGREERPEVEPVAVRHRAVEAEHQGAQVGGHGHPQVEDGQRSVASDALHKAPRFRGQALRRQLLSGSLVHGWSLESLIDLLSRRDS